MPLPFFKQDDKRKLPADVIREICDWLRYDVQSSEDGSKSWKLKKERVATLRACRLVSRAWCQGASFAFSDSTTLVLADVRQIPGIVLTHRRFLSKVRQAEFGHEGPVCKPLCMFEILGLLECLESLQTISIYLDCRCSVKAGAIPFKADTIREAVFYFRVDVYGSGTNLQVLLHVMPNLKTLALYGDQDLIRISAPYNFSGDDVPAVLPKLEKFKRGQLLCGTLQADDLLKIVSLESFRNVTSLSLDLPSFLEVKIKKEPLVLKDILASNLKHLTVYDWPELSGTAGFRAFALDMITE